MARTISESVGKLGRNLTEDVRTVQELLNNHIARLAPLQRLTPDGKIGPRTIEAIEAFQKRVVGLLKPDGLVEPKGRTLAALNQGATAPAAGPPAAVGSFRVTFQH